MLQFLRKICLFIGMALHDTSKNSQSRDNPMPNVHNHIIPEAVMAHNTVSSHYSLNTPTSGYLQQRNTQFIANDGTSNKALFGYNSALNDWGLYVADSGVDVTTNTDPSKLVFNSSQNIFKIVTKGTSTIPSFVINPSGSALLTIPHGLSYVPLVNVYVEAQFIDFQTSDIITSSYVPLPIHQNTTSPNTYWFTSSLLNSLIALAVTYAIDATNLYIQASYSTSSGATQTMNPIPVTYFLLQETAT